MINYLEREEEIKRAWEKVENSLPCPLAQEIRKYFDEELRGIEHDFREQCEHASNLHKLLGNPCDGVVVFPLEISQEEKTRILSERFGERVA